jgi:hypothetical protein
LKSRLVKIRDGFFAQKYRLDIGLKYLNLVNFVLLILTNVEKIQKWLGLEKGTWLIFFLALIGGLSVWFVGYILDKYVRSTQMEERQGILRSEIWQRHFEETDKIIKMLEELKNDHKRSTQESSSQKRIVD